MAVVSENGVSDAGDIMMLCQDDVDLPPYPLLRSVIMESIGNIDEHMTVNGLPCNIQFIGGRHYCGYCRLTRDAEVPGIRHEDFDEYHHDIYCVHGGFTAHLGFDCAHYDDLSAGACGPYAAGRYPRGIIPTFKTRAFVFHELERLTMSILEFIDANRLVAAV